MRIKLRTEPKKALNESSTKLQKSILRNCLAVKPNHLNSLGLRKRESDLRTSADPEAINIAILHIPCRCTILECVAIVTMFISLYEYRDRRREINTTRLPQVHQSHVARLP